MVALAGGVAAADPQWSSRLQANTADERVQSLLSALSVEAVPTSKELTTEYASVHVHRLRELTALRRIADLKSKLQRTNPVEEAVEYNRMFGELVALEQHRRTPARARHGPVVTLFHARADRAPAEVLDRAGLGRGEQVLAFAERRRPLVARHPAGAGRCRGGDGAAALGDGAGCRLGPGRVHADGDRGRRVRPAAGDVLVRLVDPALLLQLVRERVTASVVLQRGFLWPASGLQGDRSAFAGRRPDHLDARVRRRDRSGRTGRRRGRRRGSRAGPRGRRRVDRPRTSSLSRRGEGSDYGGSSTPC